MVASQKKEKKKLLKLWPPTPAASITLTPPLCRERTGAPFKQTKLRDSLWRKRRTRRKEELTDTRLTRGIGPPGPVRPTDRQTGSQAHRQAHRQASRRLTANRNRHGERLVPHLQPAGEDDLQRQGLQVERCPKRGKTDQLPVECCARELLLLLLLVLLLLFQAELGPTGCHANR